MKILLMGHACSPARGSEPAVTWNWAWSLSAQHQVYVIAYPQDREDVENFLEEHPNPNLKFEWVTLPSYREPWRPENGSKRIRLHYLFWQREAFKAAARLNKRHNFDLAHYVSWNSISAPPMPHKINIPFVWGPVGGGMMTPRTFTAYYGADKWKEYLRSLRVRLMRFSPALRRAIQSSSLLLATNYETRDLLLAAGAKNVEMFWDAGRPAYHFPEKFPQRSGKNDEMTLLWAGNLEPWKAFPLALEAVSKAQSKHQKIRLLVAGDGSRRREYERLVEKLGLKSSVDFLGRVKWEKMPELFLAADAFLFTSVRDSSGSVVMEAMAYGLPIITLNHQGVGFFVPPAAGIKVPVTVPSMTADDLADGIVKLAKSPQLRKRMGEAAWKQAKTQASDIRAEAMNRLYEKYLFTKSTNENS